MGASGTTTVDFGAAPGVNDTSVAVTGQGSILSGSLVEAWLWPAATADHTVEEHLMAKTVLHVIAGAPTASVGFTIYAICEDGPLSGLFTVAWAWN